MQFNLLCFDSYYNEIEEKCLLNFDDFVDYYCKMQIKDFDSMMFDYLLLVADCLRQMISLGYFEYFKTK